MGDVLKATYSDLKTVKTRSTCQLILELPIEALTEVVNLLGAPVPGGEVWVAVARLKPEAVKSEPDSDDEPNKPPRPLSQVAAILCGIVAFRRWLEDTYNTGPIVGEEEAAAHVRRICGITSRRELDTNEIAARHFRNMRADYNNWMNGVAA